MKAGHDRTCTSDLRGITPSNPSDRVHRPAGLCFPSPSGRARPRGSGLHGALLL